MKEMKNTALIKRNVLLLARGHSGLQLRWGWMHLATMAATTGWSQPERRERGLQQGGSVRPPWASRQGQAGVPRLRATRDGMLML